MPKVSVIVPVYGVEKYIERCARSLFEQTLDDIEYLFIDDCTPDRSIEILQQVLEDYPHRKEQVIIHRMEQNSGQAKVREWGIKKATGEYLIHCDTDDWVDKDMYRAMYEMAQEDKAAIVICDYYKVTNSNKEYIKGRNIGDKDSLISDLITEKVSWSVWNKLVKNSLYWSDDILFPRGNMGEDMALIMQLILKANKISYLPKPLYFYLYNPLSITHQKSEGAIYNKYMQFTDNVNIVLSSFNRLECSERYDKELSYLKWCARRCLWSITNKPRYRAEWFQTFPEIIPSILWTSFLKTKVKIKIILTYLRLYPKRNYFNIIQKRINFTRQ